MQLRPQVTGLWRNAFVLALLLLPASVFASWVLRQQQNHGVTYVSLLCPASCLLTH